MVYYSVASGHCKHFALSHQHLAPPSTGKATPDYAHRCGTTWCHGRRVEPVCNVEDLKTEGVSVSNIRLELSRDCEPHLETLND